MSEILNQMLGKLGITYKDLNQEERDTFNAWRDALSGRKLTDDDVKNFLDVEYNDSVKKLATSENSKELDMFLKMKVDFIIKVKEFLASPETEKMMVEQQISSQK
jgi:hypothetical protein